ncbi:unnamed protein product, partial [Allacma fusca]
VMDSPFDLMALSPEIFEDAQDLPPYTPPFSSGPSSPPSPQDLGIDDQLPPLFLLQDPPSSPQDPFPMYQNPVSNSTDVSDSNALRDSKQTLSDISLPASPTPTEIIDEPKPISHPIHDPVISTITTQATLPLITLKLSKLQLPSVSLPLIRKPPIPTLPVPIKSTPQLVKPKPNLVPVSDPVPLMSLNVGLPPPVQLRNSVDSRENLASAVVGFALKRNINTFTMNFGKDDECDQNGNFCAGPNNQKESVLQIISETLRGSSSGQETPPKNSGITKHDEVPLDNRNFSPPTSEVNLNNFNPGDKLSSSIPPLAPQSPDFVSNAAYSSGKILDSNSIFAVKDCHLSTVLGSARRCLKQLKVVKEGLASLVSQDERLSQGKKISNPGSDYELVALLGEYIMYLTRQVFTPAHRLYTSALGLHMAEDLIRNPKDPTLLNFRMGYVIRPDWNTIIHTQMKLRACVDCATEMYNRFGREASASNGHVFQVEQMQYVMVTLMHAFQDLYATALGSTDIFKVLLHIEDYGETILQEFLLSLESMDRSDLLFQVQTLRRSFDDIVILTEQLSWAAYVVYRLASGKSLTPSPDGSISRIPGEGMLFKGGKIEDEILSVNMDSIRRKPSSARKSSTSMSKTDLEFSPVSKRERESTKSRENTSRVSSSSSRAKQHSTDSYSRRQYSDKPSIGAKTTKSFIPTPTGSPQQRSRRPSRTTLSRPDPNNMYARSASRSSSKGNLSGHNTMKKPSDGKEYLNDMKPKKHKSKSSRSSSRESGLSVRDTTKPIDGHRKMKNPGEHVPGSGHRHKSSEREGSEHSHGQPNRYRRSKLQGQEQ